MYTFKILNCGGVGDTFIMQLKVRIDSWKKLECVWINGDKHVKLYCINFYCQLQKLEVLNIHTSFHIPINEDG